MNSDEEKIEEAIFRRRFDEWTFRGVTLLFPVVLVMVGWAFSLQGRLQELATLQDERGPRIISLEQKVSSLTDVAKDPASKPETKVALESIQDRMNRIEERINNLHNYMLALPIRPAPAAPAFSKRGDLRLDDFLKDGPAKSVN